MVCGGWKVAGLGGCGGRVLDSNSSTSLPGGNQVDGLPPASSFDDFCDIFLTFQRFYIFVFSVTHNQLQKNYFFELCLNMGQFCRAISSEIVEPRSNIKV